MTRRGPRWPVVVAATFAWVLCAAGDPPDPERFAWIRDFLAEFSIVSDGAGDGPRDIMSTRLETHPDAGFAILSYRRTSYAGFGVDTIASQQTILYTVRLAGVDAASIRVQPLDAFNSDATFWMVQARLRDQTEFVPYTNLFERRLDDGTVDVSSSRGRVREIVLGYFATEDAAVTLAERFRNLIERPESPEPKNDPTVDTVSD